MNAEKGKPENPGGGNGNQGHEKFISLNFVVNGEETTVEKVNLKQPLKVAVQKALEETGNTGRPITDWQVKWNDVNLDISQKVEDFNFPEGAILFVDLKSGQGGYR